MSNRVSKFRKLIPKLLVTLLLVFIGAGTAAVYGLHPDFTGYATAIDNCDPNPSITYYDVSDTNACGATITRTWQAVDVCGNSAESVQTIRIVDIEPPLLYCPPSKSINCDSSTYPSHTGYATAADNCDPHPTIKYIDTWDMKECGQTLTRVWVATDACGNSARCVQKIKLVDYIGPFLRCPPDITITCKDSRDPLYTGYPIVKDNCDPNPVVTYRDVVGLRGCSGYITRTWQATDSCGNTRFCMQRIKVVDNTPPVFGVMPYVNQDCEALPDDIPDCECNLGWSFP